MSNKELQEQYEDLQGFYKESVLRIAALNEIIQKYNQETGIDPFDLMVPKTSEGAMSYPCKIGLGPSKLGGKGVFATQDIGKGEVVEVSPVLVVLRSMLNSTPLVDYYFPVDDEGGLFCAIVFGWGSMYNHSDNPSVHWIMDVERREVLFLAIRDIKEGEEITHDYGPSYWDCPARQGQKR